MKRLILMVAILVLAVGVAVSGTIYQTTPAPKITYPYDVGIKVATDETLVDTSVSDSGLTREVSVVGKSSVSVQVQGAWTGTLLFEGSNSDTPTAAPTFVSLYAIEPNDGTIAAGTTDNGLFIVSVGGLKTFRVRSQTSAWTGKATIKMQTSLGVYKPTNTVMVSDAVYMDSMVVNASTGAETTKSLTGVKQIKLKARSAIAVRIATGTGSSTATTYDVIASGTIWELKDLNGISMNLAILGDSGSDTGVLAITYTK